MGSLAAIQLLVDDSFSELCPKENHGRTKRVLRLISCVTVCTRCRYPVEPTLKVVKYRDGNCVWVKELSRYVDCSGVQMEDVEGRELMRLQPNHREYNCEVDNFCSLACKIENVRNQFETLSSIDLLKLHARKKRTGGRRKGEVDIFHRFYRMFLVTRRARSGGRRRRISMAAEPAVEEGNLPPKKRRNRGG